MDVLSAAIGLSVSVAVMLAVALLRRKEAITFGAVLGMFLLGCAIGIPVALIERALLGEGGSGLLTFGHALVVGVCEELEKGLLALPFILRTRRRTGGSLMQIDGIMCCMVTAAGFSFLENACYLSMGYTPHMRALASLGHVTYGVIIGAAIVRALNAKGRGDKVGALRHAIGGFALAVVLHAVWDSGVFTGLSSLFYSSPFYHLWSIPVIGPLLITIGGYSGIVLTYLFWAFVACYGIWYAVREYRLSRQL